MTRAKTIQQPDEEDEQRFKNFKEEVDKFKELDVVVLDGKAKQHLREILRKNPDKFLKRIAIDSSNSSEFKCESPSRTPSLLNSPAKLSNLILTS